MAERFLILGASSFYGSNFAKLVEEKGDVAIRMWHRPKDGHAGWDIDDYVYGELGSAPQVYARGADYVVNFISRSLVAESWEHPDAWAQTNVVGMTRLFDDLRQERFKKFIHVSTPEVYGSLHLWREESWLFNPSTPYAASRAAGDLMLKAYHKSRGFPMLITRTANIYGSGQQPYKLIPKAIACKASGDKFPLHGFGTSLRSYIHVKDACEATYLLAKNGDVGETYHISTDEAHTVLDVLNMLDVRWEPAPERLGKDGAYLLDSTKIRKLGWQDKISLEEGLRECDSLTI